MESCENSGQTWRRRHFGRYRLDHRQNFNRSFGTPERPAERASLPTAIEKARTEGARTLIKYGLHNPAAMTRPYALPPGTPKDRVGILRRAFLETFNDPAFIAEAKKSSLEVDPLSGEELQQLVAGVFKLDAGLVSKLKEIMK